MSLVPNTQGGKGHREGKDPPTHREGKDPHIHREGRNPPHTGRERTPHTGEGKAPPPQEGEDPPPTGRDLGESLGIVGSRCQNSDAPRDSRREGRASHFGVPGAGNLWVCR